MREVERGQDGSYKYNFSNFRTGTSFLLYAEANGRYKYLQVERVANDRDRMLTRTPIKRRERALGENCFVWKMGYVASYLASINRLDCIANDGITLWSRFYSRSGVVGDSWQAISLDRRPQAVSDAKPPADMLDWSRWHQLEKTKTSQPLENDFEVVLDGGGMSSSIRRHSDVTLIDTKYANGVRHLELSGPTITLHYGTLGGSRSLIIRRHAPVAETGIKTLDRSDFVLGEMCLWFDVGGGIEDAGKSECQTVDGVPLKIEQFSRGGHTSLTATRISRKSLGDRSTDPPADVFKWP